MGEYNYNRVVTTMNSWKEGDRWYVTQEIKQGRKKENGDEWEYKAVSVRADSDHMDRAIAECSFTMMQYLEKVKGDLFAEVEEKEKNDSDQSNEVE